MVVILRFRQRGDFGSGPRPAAAQPLPVAVSPTRIEMTASPGDHVESSFKFWNGTDSDLPIHLEAVDVAPQDELGHAAVEPEAAVNSLKSWVTPEYTDLNVAPKQEITLPTFLRSSAVS